MGMLSVMDGAATPPPAASDLAVKGASISGNQVTLDLSWKYPDGAARYFDIWKLGPKGNPTWLLRTASRIAWLEKVPFEPDGNLTLAVQPVDYAGVSAPISQAARYVVKKQ
jgi:hypothetical protein